MCPSGQKSRHKGPIDYDPPQIIPVAQPQIIMRSLVLLSLVLSLLAYDLDAQRRNGRRRGGRSQDDSAIKLQNFTFKQASFPAQSLEGKEAKFGIYLPKGYDEEANAETRYPTVIWLHGFSGSHQTFHHRGGAKILDRLAGEKKLPPMILVALSASRRSVYVNGENFGNTEDLVVKDLVAHIQTKYRSAKRRQLRAIMGISMGGMGALKMAWKHPDVFGQVAVHSSAILPADPTQLSQRYQRMATSPRMGLVDVFGDPIKAEKWAAEMPMAIASTIDIEKLAKQRIYFDAGTRDRYGFAEPNEDLHKLLLKRKIAHSFELIEDGGHSWSSENIKAAIAKSLQFVGKGFVNASASLDKDEAKGEGDGEKKEETVEAGK